MSRFVVLYRAPMTAREQMSKATPDDGKAWMDWFGQWGEGVVDFGGMLDIGHRVGISGSSQGDPNVTGFSILEAESMEAAIAMVQSHPHLSFAEGCEIEVREYLTPPM
jgi:hypothetical protein